LILARPGSVYLGLGVAVAGGSIYGLFLPAFNVATNDSFGLLAAGVAPLSIYAANFYFSLAFAATSVTVNAAFLYLPPLGTARRGTQLGRRKDEWAGKGWTGQTSPPMMYPCPLFQRAGAASMPCPCGRLLQHPAKCHRVIQPRVREGQLRCRAVDCRSLASNAPVADGLAGPASWAT
jgi:Ureide permease